MNPAATRDEDPEMHARLDRLDDLMKEILGLARALVERRRQAQN